MFQPEAYFAALFFMVTSMVCWGSWANTMKLTPGYAFQLFYWDYVIGILLGALVWGFTLGSLGHSGFPFLNDIYQADLQHILYAMAGGAVFNIANLLLVAAIDISGMAVAFPVGIGLALVVGVLLNYALEPKGNPLLPSGGVTVVMLAIIVDAMAYHRREKNSGSASARGIGISVACGILMAIFRSGGRKGNLWHKLAWALRCRFVLWNSNCPMCDPRELRSHAEAAYRQSPKFWLTSYKPRRVGTSGEWRDYLVHGCSV